MPTPSVPLSLIATRDVPYEWHDAVAIVAQLVEQLRSDVVGAGKVMPGLDGVTLEANGLLTLTLGPTGSMPAMPGAARVLQQLLGGREQPTPLRLGLLRATNDELTMQLDEFAAELSRWERPNRQAKLVALHQRAVEHLGLAQPAPVSANAPMVVSTAARVKTLAARKRPADQTQPRASLSRREGALLGVAGAAVVIAAAWIATGQPIPLVSGGSDASQQARLASQRTAAPATAPDDGATAAPSTAPPDAQPDSAVPQPSPDVSAPVAAADATAAPPEPPLTAPAQRVAARRAVPGPSEGVPRPGVVAAARQGGEAASPRQVENPNVTGDVRRTVEPPARVLVPPPVGNATGLTRVGDPIRIEVLPPTVEFREGDAGVIPPVPLARLPRAPEPGTPASQLQVLEVHVNADGTVETARFVDSSPSYRNRWWASAAKSWRFRPALRNGQPVRYVLRIVIQDPGGA